ncbi:MAG: nucleotidyltransferase family protein [Candidatus Aminicenantes bacterium]|nr:MAG: nucleotidyltransferase family protein [Candidatus Aminicenantes bacterium]
MICAMILAAGESKRMGKPKLLLPFGEKTMIETVIDNVVKSKAGSILVVLGADSEKIEEKIKGLPVEIVFNPNFHEGMLSSAQIGFQTLPEDAQAVLVFLGDQPAISHAVINEVIDAYKKTKKGIILPVYEGNRGHPVLIDVKYRGEVEKLSADVGLRGVVYSHPEDVQEVEVETPNILQDIDDADDYDRELELKNKK